MYTNFEKEYDGVNHTIHIKKLIKYDMPKGS